MREDFRSFLQEMEETREGGFFRVTREVDTRYEVSAIITKLEQARQIPLLLFEKVRGHGMPVVDEFFEGLPRPTRVLLADDDPTVVEAVRRVLMATVFDIQIETALDGYETLIKAGDYKPDLLILDLRMPHMDGLEVCRRLRSNPNLNPAMKILAVTGHSDAYNQERVVENGANDYLLKPFDIRTLLEHVKLLLP